MTWLFAIKILLSLSVVTALPAPASHVVHEERDTSHGTWLKRDRLSPDTILPVRIGLAQNNLDNAQEYLMDVSHPHSPNYGKHWTPEQVIEAFKPSEDTIEIVHKWLLDSGIEEDTITHTDNKAWFAFYATSEQLENLLHTEFHEFEHVHNKKRTPACDRYHVPEHVQQHVDYITPGIRLVASMNKRESKRMQSEGSKRSAKGLHHRPNHGTPPHPHTNLDTCDITITPACIAALYEIPPATLADPSNSMGLWESEVGYWDQRDLNLFYANLTPWIPKGTHPINNLIDGAKAVAPKIADASIETMLDLDMAYPIVYPQTITIWEVDDLHDQIYNHGHYSWTFNTFLDAIDGSYCTYCAYGECGDNPTYDPKYPDPAKHGYKGPLQCGVFKPTNVVSISYGGWEAGFPIAYQKRQCNEFLKLGLQGVSFLWASGDAGVGNWPPPYGHDCLGPDKTVFNPEFPNTCPWGTNVGATKVYPGKSVFEPESAVYDPVGHPYHVNYSSGGGFSNIYPIPAYQKEAVATYFAEHNPPYPSYSYLVPTVPNPKRPKSFVEDEAARTGGIYNRIGRGYPDVAANGDNAATYVNGTYQQHGGTSMSTPIFAAIINRINDERIAAGKSVLGFLNPALYAHPEMLNDITNGTNPGCGTLGFSAVKGWDPVTGLGTPNYPRMLEYFMSLP